MEIINDLYLIDAIVNDDRFGGRKFSVEDMAKLQECKNEWKEVFRPVSKYFYISDDEKVVVEFFFDNYEVVKEMVLDKGGEIMSVFGAVTKKIDEKIEKK